LASSDQGLLLSLRMAFKEALNVEGRLGLRRRVELLGGLS